MLEPKKGNMRVGSTFSCRVTEFPLNLQCCTNSPFSEIMTLNPSCENQPQQVLNRQREQVADGQPWRRAHSGGRGEVPGIASGTSLQAETPQYVLTDAFAQVRPQCLPRLKLKASHCRRGKANIYFLFSRGDVNNYWYYCISRIIITFLTYLLTFLPSVKNCQLCDSYLQLGKISSLSTRNFSIKFSQGSGWGLQAALN